MQQKKIAFIGAGNMAFAIIQGLLKNGYPADYLKAVNKQNQTRRAQLNALGVETPTHITDAVTWADVVILAIKPQMMADVCPEFSALIGAEKWVISVAAGISVARLQQLFPNAKQFIRAMPNTPALIGAGMTGLFAKSETDPCACQFAEALFNAVGECCWVEEEAQINQIIALTGSSPAYFFRFMEAMATQAQTMGFSAEQARRLVQSAALGAAKMVAENPEASLAQLRENVTSKGGTTAKALEVFETRELAQTVAEAMQAAIARAQEMEQSL